MKLLTGILVQVIMLDVQVAKLLMIIYGIILHSYLIEITMALFISMGYSIIHVILVLTVEISAQMYLLI